MLVIGKKKDYYWSQGYSNGILMPETMIGHNHTNGRHSRNGSDNSSNASLHSDFEKQSLISDEEMCPFEKSFNEKKNDEVKLIMPIPQRGQVRFPNEKCKTVFAFFILVFNMVLTSASLSLTHDRVPNQKPLPDKFLDLIPIQQWGLYVSEWLIIILVYICVFIILLHKHRWIIFRRLFLILGILYFYRSMTMYMTVLPVSNPNYYCSPQANKTDTTLILKRMLQLLSGFGLSMNGKHTYCGDIVYSGHTVCLVIAYLFIQEYTPRRLWPLHRLYGSLAALGVLMILISHGHYTLDCVIAYYITTRVFYIYHTMANVQTLKESGSYNYFERSWCYPLFLYFEENVQGVIPYRFEWPTFPRKWGSKDHSRNS